MNEEQIKEEIEQIGYQEFYRYYQEARTLIEQQKQENERLNNIINKAIEYIEDEGISFLNIAGQRTWCGKHSADDLLKILKGEDKE